MKVVCIKKTPWVSVGRRKGTKDPAFQEECTVVDSMKHDGLVLYLFGGYTDWYSSECFRISEFDELLESTSKKAAISNTNRIFSPYSTDKTTWL